MPLYKDIGVHMAKLGVSAKGAIQRIGGRLKLLRKAAGLTQAQLAEKINLDDVTVSRFENGTRTPSVEHLCWLADFFKVPTSHFLDDESAPSLVRAREISGVLLTLSPAQQEFLLKFIYSYAETHKSAIKSIPKKRIS